LYAPHNKGWLMLYLPARTAMVLKKVGIQTENTIIEPHKVD